MNPKQYTVPTEGIEAPDPITGRRVDQLHGNQSSQKKQPLDTDSRYLGGPVSIDSSKPIDQLHNKTKPVDDRFTGGPVTVDPTKPVDQLHTDPYSPSTSRVTDNKLPNASIGGFQGNVPRIMQDPREGIDDNVGPQPGLDGTGIAELQGGQEGDGVFLSDAEKETARRERLETARQAQEQLANDPNAHLEQAGLQNEYTGHDIYQKNPDGSVKMDMEGNPLVRPEFEADPILAERTEVAAVDKAVAGQIDSVEQAQAVLAEINQGTAATPEETAAAEAARNVIVQDYEASLISMDDMQSSLDSIKNEKPMEAASVANKLNGLLGEMEDGKVPSWARPAVAKVEQSLKARGISASSVGRDSLFNAIINAAMPIASADAQFQQQANQSNYQAKVNAIMQDSSQQFAAKQFNATSQNQAKQYLTGLRAQVDSQNASRNDAISQFNAQMSNNMSQFAVQQLNQMSLANLQEFNATARQNAQLSTQVSSQNAQAGNQMNLQNAQMATQVALANMQMAGQMSQFQGNLDAQREQFNSQQANAIAQATVQWRRQLNTAETAGINQVNAANVANAFNLSSMAHNNIWQYVRDEAQWAEQATENEYARRHETAIRVMQWEHDAAMQANADGKDTSAWVKAREGMLKEGTNALTNWLFNTGN